MGVFFENDIFEGTLALTDREIKKAKPNEKAYKMSDGGGMYLLVTPSGGKLWRWAYKFEGKEKSSWDPHSSGTSLFSK